ncbi:MAG: glycosyltransferase, partial [Fibrobacter sp.]|nr:glycosyltransferase [Fibrobacter sp.]
MAKIGIVLATYNGEKYLAQMLDSLVAQTRQADFIVAVDDGSKDNTPAILKSFQDRL